MHLLHEVPMNTLAPQQMMAELVIEIVTVTETEVVPVLEWIAERGADLELE